MTSIEFAEKKTLLNKRKTTFRNNKNINCSYCVAFRASDKCECVSHSKTHIYIILNIFYIVKKLFSNLDIMSFKEIKQFSCFLAQKDMFFKCFEHYFKSKEYENIGLKADNSEKQQNSFNLVDSKMASILEIFLNKKVKDIYKVYLLDLEDISSKLSLSLLCDIILYCPINHELTTTLALPDLCMRFIQEFILKKEFYFTDRMKAKEIPYFSPIYRLFLYIIKMSIYVNIFKCSKYYFYIYIDIRLERRT